MFKRVILIAFLGWLMKILNNVYDAVLGDHNNCSGTRGRKPHWLGKGVNRVGCIMLPNCGTQQFRSYWQHFCSRWQMLMKSVERGVCDFKPGHWIPRVHYTMWSLLRPRPVLLCLWPLVCGERSDLSHFEGLAEGSDASLLIEAISLSLWKCS